MRAFEARFWSKVDKSGECWRWTAARFSFGHGAFQIGRRACRAHRVAWELANGAVPDGLCVLHKCDEPSCVRVSHLFLGTKADNVHDMCAKGRQSVRGSDATRLNEALVMAIRDAVRAGETMTSVAARVGTSLASVSRIVSGKTWLHGH